MWGSLRLAPIMNLWIITTFTAIFVSQPDVSAAQDVELNSTLSEGVAYNNQEIFFTCLVRGSNVLEWNSAEYIGQGGFPLQLLSFAHTDTNVSSTTRPSTYAVRRSLTKENDQLVIVSDLRIIASTQYPVATVTCSAESSKNITCTFQTLSSVMPPLATHDVTVNITTIQYTSATTMRTTTTETTEDVTKVDDRRENQQSYTASIASLTVFLIISIMANIIFVIILIIILIIKVRCKESAARDLENDSQASGISPVPKPESSKKHKKKHKRKFLDMLRCGYELLVDSTNPNKVPTESEELIPALKSLSDALSTGTPSAFKEAIKNLTDDLRVNKVSDEVLEDK